MEKITQRLIKFKRPSLPPNFSVNRAKASVFHMLTKVFRSAPSFIHYLALLVWRVDFTTDLGPEESKKTEIRLGLKRQYDDTIGCSDTIHLLDNQLGLRGETKHAMQVKKWWVKASAPIFTISLAIINLDLILFHPKSCIRLLKIASMPSALPDARLEI